MVWNTNAIYVFADGMQNVTSNASGENKNQSDELKNNSFDATKNKDDSKNNFSDNIDEMSTTVNESTTESTNESETTIEFTTETSVDESETTKSTEETTTTTVVTETTKKKEIVEEEKIATDSEVINIDIDKLEEESNLELATISDAKGNEFFYGTEDEASMSELPPLRRFVDDVDQYLVDMEDDYVAPKSSYERGLFGTDPSTTIPSSWDSRDHYYSTPDFSYVPPIRLQSPYGICWAFSSIGMIETSIRKKGYVSTEDQSNLSELAFAYFVYDLENVTNKSDYDNLGGIAGHDYHFLNKPAISNPSQRIWSQCGGNMTNSTKMLSAYLGAVIEDATTVYSNDGTRNQAMLDAESLGLPDEYAFKKNAFVANNIQYINRTDTNAIKQAIMDNGSVGFAYYSEPSVTQKIDGFDYWADSPALHWEDGKSYFHSQNRVESDGRPMTNHAVMIVGWDDNIPKEKFYYGGALPEEIPDYDLGCYVYRKPPSNEEYNEATYKSSSNGAWLVRNSWGLDKPYLAEGYFYIPYDEPSLSETFYSIDAIKADTYKYNYHYDTTGAVFSYAPYSENTQFANIFKVSGEDDTQVLKAVNVGVDTADAEYDIKIYTKSTSMSHPMDGDLATTKRASNKVAGFYTFELDQTVTLTKDSYFSIVIEPVSTNVEIFTDFTDYSGGYYYTYNEVELGQSYYKHRSQPNSYWRDINSSSYAFIATTTIGGKLYGNSWRIKGLASPDAGVPAPAEGYYVLGKDWFDSSVIGLTKNEVENITFLNYNETVPTGADVTAWDLPTTSNGLKGYTKGKDIYIYAPANVPIKLPADSSYLFSGEFNKIDYLDNAHMTDRDVMLEGPSPAHGSTSLGFEKLKSINGLNKLNTEDVTDMQGMFYKCATLSTADFSSFNTSNVTDMSLMFADSFSDIEYLDLSSFNTSKVRSFNQMFGTSGIKEINVSSFNTSNAINMGGMFSSFRHPILVGLQKLDISNFDTSNVEIMMHMISAYNLASISVASFDTRKVKTFEGLFYDMPKLTSIDISNFDTTSANDMRWMFAESSNLKTVKASASFIAKGVTTNMFDRCTSLVGGKGTPYSSEHVDGEYARIDKGPTSSAPGYFTGDDMDTDIVTVTFDLDGKGTNFTRSVTRGTAITEPTAPTYTGYNFVHWYEEGTSDAVAYNFSQVLPTDAPATKRLIAKWTPVSYKIYYKNVDGSSITDGEYVTKIYGSITTLNIAPTKTGYVFNGWFTDDVSFNNSYDGTTDIASTQDDDKNIYAKWTANEYQVNYNLSGISATEPSMPITKKYGTALTAGTLKDPTNIPTGYTFAGWYKESTFTNEWTGADDLTTGTTAQTIYARWKAKITYNANGHGTAPAAVDVLLNATTLLPSIANVTGYTFDTTNSWYDGSDTSTATLIGAANFNYTVTAPKELFAKWNEEEYDITYDKKDGNWTGTAPAGKRKYSEEVTLPVAADIAKNDGTNDYVFKGWYTEDGSASTWDDTKKVTKINSNTVAPAGGHKFYARWNPAWKITFNMLSHGTKPADVVAEQGTKVPTGDVPTNPTDTGYIFSGWYKNYDSTVAEFDNRYTNPFNFSTDTMTANMTLFAKWKPISYTIRYNANGGIVSKNSDTKVYDTNLTLVAPTREGYDFDAWYQNYDSTTDTFTDLYDGTTNISTTNADTKDVYAKWVAHQYTVDYDLGGVTGAVAPTSTITKTYGKPLAAGVLQNPSVIPSGYEFLGWFKESTYVNQWTGEDDLTTGTTTQTIYAKWKRAIVFSVLYNGNDIGATVPTSIEITAASTINLPSTTATGYTFGGWYNSATDFLDTNRVGGASDPANVSVPTTFYAKWTPIQYYITYNALGGNLPGATTNPFTKTYGVPATLVNPTYDGYDFVGWYSGYNSGTKVYTNPFDGSTDISTDGTGKEIYAKWNPHKYNINYELSGHATAMSATEKTYGVSYTPAVPSGVATGYVFDGWFKESTFTTPYNGDDLTTGTDPQTIYARWKATVTYYVNGHGTVSPTSVDVILGNTTQLPSLTNVEGYTFDTTNSWYDGSDISTATLVGAANSNYTVNAPKNLYARWNENEWTIDYVKGTGADWATSYNPVDAGVTKRKYSEERILPVALNITKAGHTFFGWYKQGDTSETIITKIPMNTDSAVTVVAKWSENIYNITLNENGGTYVSTYSKPLTRKYSDPATLPTNADIKKTGHRLVGWYEKSDYSGTTVMAVAANTAEHKTYYAKWTPETYEVRLHENGGTINEGNVTSYTYGTGATLPTNVTKLNSVFKGWWTLDGTTTGNWGSEVKTIGTAETEEKDYYAKWAESYVITFNLLSGTTHPAALTDIANVPSSQNIESGGVVTKPADPSATNFEFKGWFTDDTFGTEYNFATPVTGTKTIYAKWANATTWDVTFDLLSGAVHPAALTDITNAPEAQHIVNGNVATKPADPSAVGYKFIGWFTDNTFASTYNYSTVITGVKTIYGKWELQKYSITYILNSATWVDESTIVKEREYGIPVTLPVAADMTRYGYVFNGWYENERFEGSQVLNIAGNVAEDKTFYARWSPDVNTRIITFNDNYSGATGEQAFILGEDTSIRTNVFTRAGYTFLRWKDISGNVYSSTNQLTGDIVLYAEWQKNPTPSSSNNNNNRPSDSNKDERGSTRGVGPIPQTTTQQQQQLQQQNLLQQQQNAAPQAVVSTVKSDQVFVSGNTANWSYDPINNTWKLSAFDLGGVPRNASNGFFVLNKITTVVVNNVVVPKIVNDTYYFDNKGNMVTGWVKSGDNKWYFFETAKTLDEGKLIIGWKNIGGGWYFFDSNDGSMMVNRTTPDGYKLGSDGRWIS